MALFQRRPQTQSDAPMIYSLGQEQTKLIVGLGNIGKKYVNNRHNIGFLAVDYYVSKNEFNQWIDKKDLKCLLTTGRIGSVRVIAIKPSTLMNLSGEAVQAVTHFYKIHPRDIIVVHDDIDIHFGQIRSRMGGGSAGNNGIKSVTQHIGADYGRIRIGIGPKNPEQIDSADFVLADLAKEEQESLPLLFRETASWLGELVQAEIVLPETRSFL